MNQVELFVLTSPELGVIANKITRVFYIKSKGIYK